jgi:hypothetical protein
VDGFSGLPGRVLSVFISESGASSHSPSMVHISSILFSVHTCPTVSSPSTEGKFHPFGTVLDIPIFGGFPCRVVVIAGPPRWLNIPLVQCLHNDDLGF